MKKLKLGQAIMLSTNLGSIITKGTRGKERGQLFHFKDSTNAGDRQHLYIIANEEIEFGDYHIATHLLNESEALRSKALAFTDQEQLDAINAMGGYDKSGARKVIASTDKSLGLPLIPESFVLAYIKAYNNHKPITEVNLEMYRRGRNSDGIDADLTGGLIIHKEDYWVLRVREDNTVIIHQCKNYSNEEVLNLFDNLIIDLENKYETISNPSIAINKWLVENNLK